HYANVLCDLVRFQLEGLENLDRSLCYNGVHFDAQGMRNDCQYFEEQFVRRQEVPYSPTELHRDFDLLVAFLKEADCNFFCYRDFQARNILIKDGKLFYIDYQSGRQGPLQCDVASLLFQSQAKIPDRDREDLLAGYLEELCSRSDIVQERFKEYYYGFVVLRLMQVLGAYGKLGLGLGKQYFREGIPSAVLNLQTVVQAYGLAIAAPELVRLIGSLPVMEDIS
ncbi:MAG: phosphotransferase, partial [Bdellovibrionales bacterium]|nr:phosphotransferase [Bdellovibrionales bacterium]